MENKPTDDEYWIKPIPIDPSAFEVIYDRYLLQVYRYIYRKVGNQAEARYLTSIVFLDALEGISKVNTHLKINFWHGYFLSCELRQPIIFGKKRECRLFPSMMS